MVSSTISDQGHKCVRKVCQTRSFETKEALMAAATHLFAEKGFHKVNTKDIAKAAGVAVGSFYGYYADKKQLLLEIIETYKEALLSAGICNNQGARHDYPMDQVINYFINQKLQVAERYPLAFHLEINHMKYRDEDVAALLERFTQREMTDFVARMAAHKEQLRIQDLELGAALIYQINDNMIMAYLSTDNAADQQALIAEYKTMITRYLLKD